MLWSSSQVPEAHQRRMLDVLTRVPGTVPEIHMKGDVLVPLAGTRSVPEEDVLVLVAGTRSSRQRASYCRGWININQKKQPNCSC